MTEPSVYIPRLARRYARSGMVLEPCDLAQEAALRALEKPSGAGYAQAQSAMIEAVRGWCGRTGSAKADSASQHRAIEQVIEDRRGELMTPATQEAGVVARELRDRIRKLRPREQAILMAMYWFGRTGADVALEFGVCPERISQLHTKALRRLRKTYS